MYIIHVPVSSDSAIYRTLHEGQDNINIGVGVNIYLYFIGVESTERIDILRGICYAKGGRTFIHLLVN